MQTSASAAIFAGPSAATCGGVKSLISFHKALLTHPCFVEVGTCHGLVESELMAARAAELENGRSFSPDGAAALTQRETIRAVEVDGRRFEVRLLKPEPAFAELARRRRERGPGGGTSGAANDAVIKLLARALGVSRSELSIISGATSRHKRVEIPFDAAEARGRLGK